mmetsp:Transcript_66904/g.156846  ORF Transcript_66904/g.156846 Transcript_66904/m.156846 type:complete len:418 (-) Transcript_66904:754-2007(-)
MPSVKLDLGESGSGEDSLGLLDRVHLVLARCLAGVEVRQQKVAALVELCLRLRKAVQGLLCPLASLASLGQGLLQLGLLSLLAGNSCLLLRNRVRGVGGEALVGLLCALLSPDGLLLHGSRVLNERLEHRHDAEALAVAFVILEAARGLRTGLGMDLDEGLLVVEFSKHHERLLEEPLRLTLVRDDLLKLRVLLLPVLACELQLLLHLRHLRLIGLLLRLRRFDVDGILLGHQRVFKAGLAFRLELVLTEFLDAVVFLRHLVLLLLLQGEHHVIHGLLHLHKLVQLHLCDEGCHAWVPAAGSGQDLCSPLCPSVDCRLLEEGGCKGLLEVGMCLVGVQNLNGLGNCLGFLTTGLLALIPLCIHLGTLLLDLANEGEIGPEHALGVLDLLLLHGPLLVGGCTLLLLGLNLLSACLDLG